VKGFWIALATIAALLTACPGNDGSGPVDECTKTGQQCRLEKGLLGVCSPTGKQDCAKPPCLECAPQH
jgi:hypothetical protein